MSSQNFGMKSYMKGALLLTIAAIIVKILSAIYRVPFQNLVGDQGFYVYQQVYPFVAIFVTWTAGGVAVAISKLLAEERSKSDDNFAVQATIIKIVFRFLVIVSLVVFALLFFGAAQFAKWMGDESLAMPLRVGSFVVLIMPFMALFKGAFQSMGLMQPIATSQIFEQTMRVTIILAGTFIIMATSQSVYMAGSFAVFGTVMGELFGVLFLFYYYRKQVQIPLKLTTPLPQWPIIKSLLLFSLSVSMSSLLLLVYQLIDSFTIFGTLVNIGYDFEVAQSMKGIYDRGQPLVQLGLVIASSLALAIVPLIAFKSNKQGGRGAIPYVRLTYKATIVFAVAAAVGLMLIMPFINEALFKTNVYSNVLAFYSFQIIPLAIIITMTAILQGYSKLFVPAVFLISCTLLKWIGNLFLLPKWELLGVAIASNASLTISALAILIYLRKIVKVELANIKFYVQLVVATICMVIDVLFTRFLLGFIFNFEQLSRMSALIVTLVLVGVGMLTFITVIAKLRVLKEKEWFVIPLGRRVAAYQLWLNKK